MQEIMVRRETPVIPMYVDCFCGQTVKWTPVAEFAASLKQALISM